MIGIQLLNARGNNKNGDAVLDYLLATEKVTSYYVGPQGTEKETMRWFGKGADALNLIGKEVNKDDMSALAQGFSPSGDALCQNAGSTPQLIKKTDRNGNPRLDENGKPIEIWKGGHRVGFDMTCSAPKSVDIVFALCDNEIRGKVLSAHRKAVDEAMEFIQSKVETRRGKGGKDFQSIEGLVITQCDHLANRNLDPDLHTHNLIYGVAQGEDGKWGTYESQELYRWRHAADHIYRSALANNLQQEGFAIRQTVEKDKVEGLPTGRRFWEIQGVDDGLKDHFSSRQNEIHQFMKEHGVDKRTAWAQTRKHKDEPSPEELFASWTMTQKDLGIPFDIEEARRMDNSYAPDQSDAEILGRLTANNAIFCEHDLITQVGYAYAGKMSAKELLERVEQFKQDNNLISVSGQRIHEDDAGTRLARVNREERYTTPEMLKMEQEVQSKVKTRANDVQHHVKQETLERVILDYESKKGFELSDEQLNAIEHVSRGTGGTAIMSGLAGTGKTTIAEVYKKAFEEDGFKLVGAAVSKTAADKLATETGIESYSVSALLQRLRYDQIELSPKSVVVLDESGMVGTEDTLKLMSYIDKAGAKLIMQGDREQLQPISAGSAMALAQDVIGDCKLTEIRRQKRQEDRDVAKMFYDRDESGAVVANTGVKSRAESMAKGEAIFNALDARGCLDDYSTRNQSISALVDDYLASQRTHESKLILTHSHEDARAVTTEVRERLRKAGELGETDHKVRARHDTQFVELDIAKGDRMMFLKNNHDLDVNNGTEFTVNDMHYDKDGALILDVTLQDEDPKRNGRRMQFNTSEMNAMNHAYTKTVHKAQGQGRSEVFHLANVAMMDNQSALVAMTRLTDGFYRMYGTSDDFDQVKGRLGMDRLKENAVDALPKQHQETTLKAEDTDWIEKHIREILVHKQEQKQEQVQTQKQKRSRTRSR